MVVAKGLEKLVYPVETASDIKQQYVLNQHILDEKFSDDKKNEASRQGRFIIYEKGLIGVLSYAFTPRENSARLEIIDKGREAIDHYFQDNIYKGTVILSKSGHNFKNFREFSPEQLGLTELPVYREHKDAISGIINPFKIPVLIKKKLQNSEYFEINRMLCNYL